MFLGRLDNKLNSMATVKESVYSVSETSMLIVKIFLERKKKKLRILANHHLSESYEV